MTWPGQRWDDEQDARLRELAARHLSCSEIATAMGRTLASIKRRAHRLGVSFGRNRPWTGPEMRRLMRLSREHVPMKQIAVRMNRTYSAIAQELLLLRRALRDGEGA